MLCENEESDSQVLKIRYRMKTNKLAIKGQEFIFYSALYAVMATRPASQPDTFASSDRSFTNNTSLDSGGSPKLMMVNF